MDTAFPLGAKAGTDVEVTVAGADLTDLSTLNFDTPGLTCTKIDSQKFRITVAPDCPPGLHELRAVGKFGISTPRPFVVGTADELIDSGSNHTRDTAMLTPIPCVVDGRTEPDQRDTFKFAAAKGETIQISCVAFALDSPVDPVVVIMDSSGRTLARGDDERDRDVQIAFTAPADGEYFLAVHDKQFGGGAAHVYRLSLAREPSEIPLRLPRSHGSFDGVKESFEAEPNDLPSAAQPISLPTLIRGTFDTDHFSFKAEAGRPLWIAVQSDDDGVSSDAALVISKITHDGQGNEQRKQMVEMDDQPELAPSRWFVDSRDPAGGFTPDEAATYVVRVIDRFGGHGGYRLLIRDVAPDFSVVALPDSPANEEKKLFVWQPNARRGGSAVFAVAALRRGYTGEIRLRAEGLPDGMTASGAIPAGSQTGWLAFYETADASPWAGLPRVIAEGGGVVREVRAITYRWSVDNRDNVRAAAHLSSLGVGGIEEAAPLTISLAESRQFEATIGSTLEIPLRITRAGQPKGEWQIAPVGFPGLVKFDPVKIDGAATAEVKLVLNLENKNGNTFVPGTFTFVLRARGLVSFKADEKAPPKDVPHVELSSPITIVLTAPATAAAK